MPAPVQLNHDPQPVEVAPDLLLEAPAFRGEARSRPGGVGGTSVLHDPHPMGSALEGALDSQGLTTEHIVELDVAVQAFPAPRGPSPTTRTGAPAQRLIKQDPHPDRDYALLYTDEAGISRWIFPDHQPRELGSSLTPGAENSALSFAIPTEGARSTRASDEIRGLNFGPHRVARVLSWAAEPLAGRSARWIAKRWEAANRPYGLWQLVDSGTALPVWREQPLDRPAFWEALSREGPVLLFLHGTFSTAQAGFARLLELPQLAELRAHYDGRLLAFNHPSLHQDPTQNAATLLEAIPPGVPLQFDLIAHSRGCLVGRALAEGATAVSRPEVAIRRALFLAAPNRGTVLASRDRWTELVDRLTNLFSVLPPTSFGTFMESLLVLVKIIGRGALGSLPGLTAISPRGKYLKELNRGRARGASYFAVTADFEPGDPNLAAFLLERVGDELRDRFFDEANDGIVPTKGGFDSGVPGPDFPIPDVRTLLLDRDDHVHHSLYVATPQVVTRFTEWLTG